MTDAKQRLMRTGTRGILSASSYALIGASEKSLWTRGLLTNADAIGQHGGIHLVSRSGAQVLGRPSVRSCREIAEAVDLGLIAVPPDAVVSALSDAASAGITAAVVLAGGYAETGPDGVARQDELTRIGADLGVTVLGPNCLGFLDLNHARSAWFGAFPHRVTKGSVAIVSQSGSLAVAIAGFAGRQGIGVSHIVSTGNEAAVRIDDVIDALLDDADVRAFAVFAEAIRDHEAFLQVARLALEAGKPLVVHKVGRSELGRQLTLSHTGAVADDVNGRATLASAGAIVVDSIEELVVTAGLIAHTGVLPPGGLALLSSSGGVVDVAADRADQVGIDLPQFDDGRLLGGQLPLRNPLDLTGHAYSNLAVLDDALDAFLRDPRIALIAYGQTVLPRRGYAYGGDEFLARLGAGLARGGRRALMVGTVAQEVDPSTADLVAEVGVPFLGTGLDCVLVAVANAISWSARVRTAQPAS